MIEQVRDADRNLIATIFKDWRPELGVQFFTDPKEPLQVGCMRREAGEVVRTHRHVQGERTITGTTEVLFVLRGEVWVTITDDAFQTIGQPAVLCGGDVVIFYRGGHGLQFQEKTDLWECRSGPHDPTKYKEYAKGADDVSA